MTHRVIILSVFLICTCWGFPNTANGRIIGGIESSTAQFTHVVQILAKGDLYCSGAILSKHTIVAAAQCTYRLQPEQIVIKAGSTKLNEGVSRSVSQIIQHQMFNSRTVTGDISLLILDIPLEYSNLIQPIQVETSYIGGDKLAIVTSWGLTSFPGSASSVQLYLNVETIEQEECKRLIQPFRVAVQYDHLCAYSGSVGKGVCIADSGAPLIISGKLVGLASWVRGGCGLGYPDAYTRISVYVNWIGEHIV